MADGQGPAPNDRALGRPAIIAIGCAIVALVTSVIAVIVVVRRDRVPSEAAVTRPVPAAGPSEQTVDARDVTKLKRDVVDKATDDRGDVIGVTVKDDEVSAALGLERGDVITAINGRAIRREFDVYDAVLGMSMMDASIVYVELVRDDRPVLVKWKLDGDLRTARRDAVGRRPTRVSGQLGGTPFGAPSPDPYSRPRPARDPLLDTIRKVDDRRFEVPRSTVDRLLANPAPHARQARLVPAVRAGQPDGYRVFAIRPDSLWATLGFINGDTIRTVNGLHPDRLHELKDATALEIVIARRGTELTLVIAIQ